MLDQVIGYFRRSPPVRLNVFGVCPQTHARVSTYAYMTEGQLQRFDRTLALFCPACRRAHQFARADLSLDGPRRVDQ